MLINDQKRYLEHMYHTLVESYREELSNDKVRSIVLYFSLSRDVSQQKVASVVAEREYQGHVAKSL